MPVDIIWLHDNVTIASDSSISVLKGRKVSTLNIDSVSSKHAGVYTCVASNRAGSASYSTVLNVNGIIIDRVLSLFCKYSHHPITTNYPIIPLISVMKLIRKSCASYFLLISINSFIII